MAYPQALYARAASDKPQILVDIAPIHHLLTALFEGIATPKRLITGEQSAHFFQLNPSQAQWVQQADVIITVGGALSPEINRVITRLNKTPQHIALLSLEIEGFLSYRAHHGHRHAHDHGTHDGGGGIDPHIWLDPVLMQHVIRALTQELSTRLPAHAAALKENEAWVIAQLQAVSKQVETTLAPLAAVEAPVYATYHDAYQYFERRFNLPPSPSLLDTPENIAGTQRTIAALEALRRQSPACLFSEIEVPLVTRAQQQTAAKLVAIDPEYGLLDNPAEDYNELLQQLAESVRQCAAG